MRSEKEIRERLQSAQVGVMRSIAMLRDVVASGHCGVTHAFDGGTSGLFTGTVRKSGFAEGLAWALGEETDNEVAASIALIGTIDKHMDRADQEDRKG
jgi:hypothetical protein